MKTSKPLVLIASVCGCLLPVGCASTPEGQATQKKINYDTSNRLPILVPNPGQIEDLYHG